MANQVPDEELRERLKSQWEFIILTSAFMAAVAVTFLVANEPEDNQYDTLWEVFVTLNAASFISLIVAVVQCTCFLTTLMMCPPGKAQEALSKLRFVEPFPSILLFVSILAFASSVPIYMILQFGHATSSFIIHIITAVLGLSGIMLFAYNMGVQASLLQDDAGACPGGAPRETFADDGQ